MSLNPGATIGIIGGGQLGRMLAMAASRLGYKSIILDPQQNAPAFQCSHENIITSYDDPEGLKLLAERCDVITYEFENVDVSAVESLESRLPCHPSSAALATSQDRLVEKQFFNDLGIATAGYRAVGSSAELEEALNAFEGNGILKTRRFGYDGKGQIRIAGRNQESVEAAAKLAEDTPCILEAFVPFTREVSVVAARGQLGETICFDVAQNVHRDGILHTSTIPAIVDEALAENAVAIAGTVLKALDYIGVLAIEFFVGEDNQLLVNEFAPRVHNSGHWTEAACTISQFEQHIRAVAGLPLGETTRHSNCVMQNLIGDEVDQWQDIQRQPQTLLHLYGKEETRPGRDGTKY
ncbi:MAG: 5-(carboxyamino)imidazole ribonucleotide synthase, partial [Pseudomonadota bacterium]